MHSVIRKDFEHTITFTSKNLTFFEFGNAYLIVELDGEYKEVGIKSERIRTCFRLNVPNESTICYTKLKLTSILLSLNNLSRCNSRRNVTINYKRSKESKCKR